MPTHSTPLENVRVEVAFSADPNTTAPEFVDLTSRVDFRDGIDITRGRSDEFAQTQPGRCTLTLDNTDGLLTPGGGVTTTRTNMVPNPSFETDLAGWPDSNVTFTRVSTYAASGSWSAQLAPNSASTDSFISLEGDVFGMRGGLTAGNTYTVSGTVNTPVAQTGSLHADGRARAIVLHHKAAADPGYTIVNSAQGPTTGSARVSLTFTLPVGTTEAWLRLYNGATNSATNLVQWDAVMLEESGTLGTYIEGTVDTTVSAYDVKPQNRLRVSYRDPAVDGNLLSAQDASFETSGNVGGWVPGGSVPPTLSNSTTHPQAGSRGMLITWGTGGTFPQAQLNATTAIGRTYTLSAYVWVPGGSPAVKLAVGGGVGAGSPSTVTGSIQRISFTFVATAGTSSLQVWPNTAATAGNQVWVDAVQLDEGSSVRTFTTTAAPIVYRFDGYIDEWPVAWPAGGKELSTSTVTAYDMLARLGRARALGSVIEETYKTFDAVWHFPLNEGSDSTSVGDRRGSGSTLAVTQRGTGGEIAFGDSTGPGTDGAGAPKFTPVDAGNGKYLRGTVPRLDRFPIDGVFTNGVTLVATFNTPATGTPRMIARMADPFGVNLRLGMNSDGTVYATFDDPWNNANTATSAGVFADSATHSIAAVLADTGGLAIMLYLVVDGTVRGTVGPFTRWIDFLALSTHLEVGGHVNNPLMFTGTISHVAAFADDLTEADLTVMHDAVSTGFSGDDSGARIARLASWIGLPAGLQLLDVGQSTIGHIDPTGQTPAGYLQLVAQAESGLVFASTDGRLMFRNRTWFLYSEAVDSAVDITVAADQVDPSTRIQHNLTDILNDVTVGRSGGATFRVTNEASIDEFGVLSESLTLPLATDAQAFDRASWLLSTSSMPESRLPELGLDGLEPTSGAAVRQIDLAQRVAVTGMPSQAPASTFDLRVEGYSEKISAGGWEVTANTSPYNVANPFIVDDPVYGLLDSDNRIVF